MPAGLAALNQLRAQPATWLKANALVVAGKKGIITPLNYAISGGPGKYRLDPSGAFGGDPFQAWHIPVDEAPNVSFNALTAVPVSRDGGPDMVLTTQLTGCCFAIASNPNQIFCQHVQPVGTTPGKLASDMAGGSITGVGKVEVAFGSDGQSYDNAKNRVIVVGLRKQRTWTFYAQIQDGAFNVQDVKTIWQG